MKTIIPAAAYYRASSDEQETSVPIQRKQMTEWAAKNGYKIIAEYVDDGKSGSHDTAKRIDFLRMLSDAPAAAWQVVLVTDLSRFGRLDNLKGAFAKDMLREAKKKLHSIIEGVFDWNNSKDRIIDAVLSESQHDYAIKVGSNSLKGRLNAFHEGKLFGFKVPYGFARKIIDPQGHSRIVPRTEQFLRPKKWGAELVKGDEQEVKVVEWVFNEFVTRDVGFRWLAQELNTKGVPSPNGGKWCDKIIQNLLENEKYVGDLSLGKRQAGEFFRLKEGEVVRSETTRLERSTGQTRRNAHVGLVDRDTFDRAQEKMKRRKEQHSHSHGEGGYALKGVLFCGECNRPLYGNPNRAEKKSGRTIYVCKTAVKYGKACTCSQWSVKEDEVLPFVKEKLLEAIDRELIRSAASRPPKKEKVDPSELEKKLAGLERKIKAGAKRLLEVPADLVPEVAEQVKELKSERDRLKGQIEEQARTANPTIQDILRKRQEWYESMKANLVRIELGRFTNGRNTYSSAVHFTADSLREFLIANGVRLTFWWERGSANRWNVSRIRVQLHGKTAQFEMIESEMV